MAIIRRVGRVGSDDHKTSSVNPAILSYSTTRLKHGLSSVPLRKLWGGEPGLLSRALFRPGKVNRDVRSSDVYLASRDPRIAADPKRCLSWRWIDRSSQAGHRSPKPPALPSGGGLHPAERQDDPRVRHGRPGSARLGVAASRRLDRRHPVAGFGVVSSQARFTLSPRLDLLLSRTSAGGQKRLERRT